MVPPSYNKLVMSYNFSVEIFWNFNEQFSAADSLLDKDAIRYTISSTKFGGDFY